LVAFVRADTAVDKFPTVVFKLLTFVYKLDTVDDKLFKELTYVSRFPTLVLKIEFVT
jgi:hypothetical protein